MLFNALVLTVAGYLLGSLPFGVWLGRLVTGRDIRASGSGHSGATNTLRQAGLAAALLVLALDVAKGYAAAALAVRLAQQPWMVALAAGAAVAGHCWPVFAGGRGGMGLSAAGGAILRVFPLGFVVGVGLAAAGSLLLRHSARGNLAAALLYAPVVYLITREASVSLVALVCGLVIAVRAMSDWRRVYSELWLDRPRN